MQPQSNPALGEINGTELRVFLVLAEELHFAHAAERLFLSQPHVSRTLAALERKIGGPLLARNSREVRLTALGESLLAELRPAYQGVLDALAHARAAAAGPTGQLIIGCAATTAVPALTRVVDGFAHGYPDCQVVLHELPLTQPFAPLRRGEVDLLVWWHLADYPGLTLGPVISRERRMVVLRPSHPLSDRSTVSLESLADYGFPNFHRSPELADLHDVIIPARAPSGRIIPKIGPPCHTLNEAADLIARTEAVHVTTEGAARRSALRGDVIAIPVRDLPDLELGLIWRGDRADPRIRAFAAAVPAPDRAGPTPR